MHRIWLTLVALLLVAPAAQAQKVDRNGVPYRAWDVDAGFGFHWVAARDGTIVSGDEFHRDDWLASWAGTVDVGRYWSSHLKTEVGLTLLQGDDTVTSEQVTVPDGARGYAYTWHRVKQTQVTVAATWQFLENAFAHPYVSAGARFGLLSIESSRNPTVSVWNGTTYREYPVPAVEGHSFEVRPRPYVAVGSKSYFSERTFVRPELALGFNRDGLSQLGARLAFGVDF